MKKRFKLRDFNDLKLRFSDEIALPTVSTRTITPEGYLQAIAAVTKVGVQMYPARQFGIDSDEPIGVFRPPETVFHPETISSLKMKPIVLLHPEEDVDSENHSRLAIGSVGESVEALDDERLGASIQITDKSVVEKVLSGDINELSLGYDTFVISKPGTYNGENYLYTIDGPMLNNHLAIVPNGRCGDSVKILDQGDETMNKEQAIKFLRDAGVSEGKIKAFMKDAAADAKADLKEMSKLVAIKATDIDMAALIPALISELKPQMEEIIKGSEFTTLLAKEIAASMAGGPAAADPAAGDAAAGEGGAEERTPEMVDAAIKDAAMARSKLINKAMPYIKDSNDFDIFKAKDRDILEKALTAVGFKAEDMTGKTDDYLTGLLDSVSGDREKAATFMAKDHASNSDSVLSKPMSGLDARQALKE